MNISLAMAGAEAMAHSVIDTIANRRSLYNFLSILLNLDDVLNCSFVHLCVCVRALKEWNACLCECVSAHTRLDLMNQPE